MKKLCRKKENMIINVKKAGKTAPQVIKNVIAKVASIFAYIQ